MKDASLAHIELAMEQVSAVHFSRRNPAEATGVRLLVRDERHHPAEDERDHQGAHHILMLNPSKLGHP